LFTRADFHEAVEDDLSKVGVWQIVAIGSGAALELKFDHVGGYGAAFHGVLVVNGLRYSGGAKFRRR
jgi:hypothetical protein